MLTNFGIDLTKYSEIRKITAKPLYDSTRWTYVFEDELISEKIFNHHIKSKKHDKTYGNTFKTNIENKLKSVSRTHFILSNDTFSVRSIHKTH